MTVQYLQMTELCIPLNCLTTRIPPPSACRKIWARLLGGPRRGYALQCWEEWCSNHRQKRKDHPETNVNMERISMDSVLVPVCQKHKHLCVQINNRLSGSDHVDDLYTARALKIRMLRSLWKRVSKKCFTKIYIGYIRPRLEYACAIWSGGSTSKLCRLHDRFCRRHQARLPSQEKRFKYLTLHGGVL